MRTGAILLLFVTDFDWNPETYLAQMLEEIPGYEELEAAVAAETSGLEVRTVLELGIGTGETATRVLAQHPGARWTGIDASEPMLARARERLPQADLRTSRLDTQTLSAISSRESRRFPTLSCSATSSCPSAPRTP